MSLPSFRMLAAVALVTLPAPSGAQAFAAPSFARPTWTSAQSFTTIVGVREIADGSVLVADYAEPAVYLMAPGGQSARQIGRKGSGPREYLGPWRLIALPNDSTFLIDREGGRYLVFSPTGDIVETTPFPESVRLSSQYIRGADRAGRLHFQMRYIAAEPTGPTTTPMLRWDRQSSRFDSVGVVRMPAASLVSSTGAPVIGIMPFTAADAWTVAPDGRIAMITVSPYRIVWLAPGGRRLIGATIPFTPVPVTDADKQAREPKGPPFVQTYPKTKPPFTNDAVVLDDHSRLWIGRSFARGATTREWDVVDPSGKPLGVVHLAADKRIVAVTARFVYVLWRDQDDVQWLQAYAR